MARVTVMEYERVVRFHKGALAGVLAPGRHRYRRRHTTFARVDVRERVLTVPMQELLTADGVSVKVTLVVRHRVADPAAFVLAAAAPEQAMYAALQLGLRAVVAELEAAALLADRGAVGQRLLADTAPVVVAYGLDLLAVAVKDVMFPGDLKRVFAQVTIARQEGLAAVERARGEVAALRALGNAARAAEATPALLQLRTLQVLEGTKGATVVLTQAAPTG